MKTSLERLDETLTSKHWLFRYLVPSECPQTLFRALAQEFPEIATNSWQERLDFGGVFLNGAEMHHDIHLAAPCYVEYYEPRFAVTDSHRMFPSFSADMIVFEDSDLIAVSKPAKLPCGQPREQRHYYLRKYVEDYLGKPVHMPSRLDTSAHGLVLFSKSKRMHRVLQQTFEKHQAEKYYALHVTPAVPWKKKLVTNLIGEAPEHTILRRVVETGGLKAVTHFTQLASTTESDVPAGSILLAKPQTGRTHQLRVHTSTLGHPIVGDNFYGGAHADDLRLLALRFKFHNSLSKEMVEISLPERLLPEWLPAELVVRNHVADATRRE